jgi:IclR family pca regulon transcriptional regulator
VAGEEYVQSLARGLQVLRAFGAEHPHQSLSEVAARTGLSRAATRRFLLTLADLGYLRTDGRMFSLTPRVLELGYGYLSTLTLPDLAMPHLEALSSAVQESSSASVLDGTDIVYVARVPVKRIMTVTIGIGTRFPAWATSMGRVLLASLPAGDRDAHLPGELPELTPRTLRSRADVVAELDAVAARGWAMVDGELEEGVRSLAVPVRAGSGRVVAAINVSGRSNGDGDGFRDRVLPELQRAADRITADYGAGAGSGSRPRDDHPAL